MDGLETEYGGSLKVLRLNAGEPDNARLQAELGARGHPSFVFLDASSQVRQVLLGPQTVESLRQAAEAVRSSTP